MNQDQKEEEEFNAWLERPVEDTGHIGDIEFGKQGLYTKKYEAVVMEHDKARLAYIKRHKLRGIEIVNHDFPVEITLQHYLKARLGDPWAGCKITDDPETGEELWDAIKFQFALLNKPRVIRLVNQQGKKVNFTQLEQGTIPVFLTKPLTPIIRTTFNEFLASGENDLPIPNCRTSLHSEAEKAGLSIAEYVAAIDARRTKRAKELTRYWLAKAARWFLYQYNRDVTEWTSLLAMHGDLEDYDTEMRKAQIEKHQNSSVGKFFQKRKARRKNE